MAANADDVARVQIVDAYIEMRTGAGVGYPAFHAIERGDWVEILKRRTDWYKLRTARGVTGWAHRDQIAGTLTEAGVTLSFRDLLLTDYLSRRLEMGFTLGRFEGDSQIGLQAGWRLSENLWLEASYHEASGDFSHTAYWALGLQSQPFNERRFGPTFGVGVGNLRNTPKAVLINARVTDALAAQFVVGLRGHLTERFMLRADYRYLVTLVDDFHNEEFRAAGLGCAFFF